MTENEDMVLTRLSLSADIIPLYTSNETITPASKYCLPFILKNDLKAEEQEKYDRDEARTMLNSVVMLSTNGQYNSHIPVVPTPINNITAERPQTIFLTTRMFSKGQQFSFFSRLYLDTIVDQDLLYEILDLEPTDIEKSSIISYLSSMFLLLQNNSDLDRDIERMFVCRELEDIIRQAPLQTSQKWGSIHSRRLARVLFLICIFLSPIMSFDISSQECSKMFEPIKKEKLNTLFYFIYKRDIWFGLHAITNGSLAETFAIACACAGISPITLLQICSYMAPIREGRLIARNLPPSFVPAECPNVPEIQASTKNWVNLVSLRFNNLLPPQPNNISFDVGLDVFFQLGLNNLKHQSTDLKSAVKTFFFSRSLASNISTPPQSSSVTPGFSLDHENPIYHQFAFLRALQSNQYLSSTVSRNPVLPKYETATSIMENNQNINFNSFNTSLQPSSSTSSPLSQIISQFEREQTLLNNQNFNVLNSLLFNQIPSASPFTNMNTFLSGASLPFENPVAERSNNMASFSTKISAADKKTKKSPSLSDRKPRKPRNAQKPISESRINENLNFNNLPSSHFLHAGSSTSPLQNILTQYTSSHALADNQNFDLNNFQRCGSTQMFHNSPSSSSSSGSSFLGNAESSLSDLNNIGINMALNHIFTPTSSNSCNNNLSKVPSFTNPEVLQQSNSYRLNASYLGQVPCSSASFLHSKNDSNLSKEAVNKSSNFGFDCFKHGAPSFSPYESDASSLQAGSSKAAASHNDNLSINCSNFKLNNIIRPISTSIQLSPNQNMEKIQTVNSDNLELCDIPAMSTVASTSSLTKQRLQDAQPLKQKSASIPMKTINFNDTKESAETLSTVMEPISAAVNGSSNEICLSKAEDIVSMDMNAIGKENISEDVKEIKDKNKADVETDEEKPTEELEDAQDFELLIETSYEPLIEDSISESIAKEDNSEAEEELIDPDMCPVKCICGFNHLEYQTIFCEKCRLWKHIKCLKAEKYANSEAEYCCPGCQGKRLPLSPSEAQDLVAKSLKLEYLDNKTKQCQELKLFGGLKLEWKSLLEDAGNYQTSKVGKLIYEGRMRWAVVKRGQAGRILAGFGIKAGKPVVGVNGIAAYMTDSKTYCTRYRNLNLSFLSEPIIVEMKGRNGGLAHEILSSCRPNCEIKFCVYKNNLYCYLVALCEIENDDELTIPFPDNDSLHVTCAESSPDCIDTCPSRKFSRLTKNKNEASRKGPPSKKHKLS